MRTAAYNVDVASDRRRRKNVQGTFFVLVAQKFIVLYNEKVRVEIIVELRKGQTEDESSYFSIRYRGI